MNIAQLKTFCSVARTLSFTASSTELAISQPAVSRQIAGLEAEMEARLFVREHNTLALTAAGRHLYEELPKKLEELEALFFSAHLMDIGKNRRLKLGVLKNQVLSSQLISIMRSMRDENYYMTIQQYDFNSLEKALENGDIDVAISLMWVDDVFKGCSSLHLGEEALCLAVNRDYAPEIPKILHRKSLEQFSRARPVMVPKASEFPKSQRTSMAVCMARLWPGIIEEALDCIVPMVQTGIGSALVNESHVLSQEASVDMIPIDFLSPVSFGAFWLKEGKNKSVEDFIQRLEER